MLVVVTGEAQVDHDYALPLLRELETTNEIQDLLSQSASSHSNVSVIEGDNTNNESSISHQICSAGKCNLYVLQCFFTSPKI